MEEILRKIMDEKKQKNVIPLCATLSELKNVCGYDPLPALRQLWSQQKVRSFKTLNSIAFYLTEYER